MNEKQHNETPTDMSVYERLVEDDVQTLGYFPAEQGVVQLVLIGDAPHLGTVATVPLKLEPLSKIRFITTAAQFLVEAEAHIKSVVISAPDLFPEVLRNKAHTLRVVQQLALF